MQIYNVLEVWLFIPFLLRLVVNILANQRGLSLLISCFEVHLILCIKLVLGEVGVIILLFDQKLGNRAYLVLFRHQL